MKRWILASFLTIAFSVVGCSSENKTAHDTGSEVIKDGRRLHERNYDPPWDPYTYVPYPSDWSHWGGCGEHERTKGSIGIFANRTEGSEQ